MIERRCVDCLIISGHDINGPVDDYGLEFRLGFNGRIHHLEEGYWLKFEICRVSTTAKRPHGLSYSFTMHAPDGKRLVGFDNAHDVPHSGSRFKTQGAASDHWPRTETDPGRPYAFKDAETLIDDFFDEVERTLREHGVEMRVTGTTQSRRGQ